MKILAAISVSVTILIQPSKMSPRDLLIASRPLTRAEIASVLAASQRAIAGKTFRLASNGPGGPEILMGTAGRPRRIRVAGAIIGGTVGGVVRGSGETRPPTTTTWRHDFIIITDYTGRRARECTGSAEERDLVVEYKLEPPGTRWTTSARRRDARDFGGSGIMPIFGMLQGAVVLGSGELNQVAGRPSRALTAAWIPPTAGSEDSPVLIGDPIPNTRGQPVVLAPNESVQRLWIDSRSLLPLRWEVSDRALRSFRLDFNYSSIDIRLPNDARRPQCVK